MSDLLDMAQFVGNVFHSIRLRRHICKLHMCSHKNGNALQTVDFFKKFGLSCWVCASSEISTETSVMVNSEISIETSILVNSSSPSKCVLNTHISLHQKVGNYNMGSIKWTEMRQLGNMNRNEEMCTNWMHVAPLTCTEKLTSQFALCDFFELPCSNSHYVELSN